jgi:hypothetical protein
VIVQHQPQDPNHNGGGGSRNSKTRKKRSKQKNNYRDSKILNKFLKINKYKQYYSIYHFSFPDVIYCNFINIVVAVLSKTITKFPSAFL